MSISETLGKDYDFLNTNPRLGNNIILLTYGGSHAYGTNIEGSDVDIRGCALNNRADLLGMSNFEQFIDENTDTVIYSFSKLINLIINCNPNTIEMLGCKPEHYFVLSPAGRQLLDNRKMFLSQKAVASFGGYATQQLRRLENALARGNYFQTEKEKHILGSCMSAMRGFNERYSDFENGSMALFIDKPKDSTLESEIFMNINLNHYPLRDYKNIIADLNNIVRDYDKLNKRNKKKDAAHLNKHAMHLVRLYLMCIDIVEKEEIITYRENDRQFLLDIRNGRFMSDDGSFKPEFFDVISELESKLEYAKKNTSLPIKPDMKQIEDFVISINERVIHQESQVFPNIWDDREYSHVECV